MRISDWSSDVCSSDLHIIGVVHDGIDAAIGEHHAGHAADGEHEDEPDRPQHRRVESERSAPHGRDPREDLDACRRTEAHTSELQSLMSISYAVFCLTNTNTQLTTHYVIRII